MRFPAAVFLLSALVSPAAFAAKPDSVDRVAAEPRYDPATVIDVTGTVVSVREAPPGDPLTGVHLKVDTESETMDIYLGPADFLKEFEIVFSKGDTVQIVGSRVNLGAGHVLLAREVRKGEIFLYLRDRAGHPNWPPRHIPTT